MSGRIVTADEAKALLNATTPGPWSTEPDGVVVVVWSGRATQVASATPQPCEVRGEASSSESRESNARLIAAAPDLAATVVAQAAEIERLRASLDRAHYALREWGPGCEHPGCNNLAPLRCEDCGARFCDDHDGGSAGHDSGVAAPMPHAVGPDDLMAGVAMREAQVA